MRKQAFTQGRDLSFRCRGPVARIAMAIACGLAGCTAAHETSDEPAADETAASVAAAKADHAEARQPIYHPKADARQQIDAALKIAQRDSKRVLVKFGGNWCGWCYKLHDVFTEHDVIAPLINDEYVLVMVDVDANRELFESYGKDNAKHGFPFLTVLDAQGKVLVNQNTGDLEDGPKHDPKNVEDFLRKWVASKKHADEVLQQALTEARGSDKRVLVHLGAPWCGWCHRLGELLAELDSDLERDYVVVKIDTARMAGGEALEERLRKREAKSDSGGIPWMAVLDADGKILITSDAGQGNIGCPVEDWEVEHFLVMLDKTRQALETDDLARLRGQVARVTEKWRIE